MHLLGSCVKEVSALVGNVQLRGQTLTMIGQVPEVVHYPYETVRIPRTDVAKTSLELQY
jgi:hypothetical protein